MVLRIGCRVGRGVHDSTVRRSTFDVGGGVG